MLHLRAAGNPDGSTGKRGVRCVDASSNLAVQLADFDNGEVPWSQLLHGKSGLPVACRKGNGCAVEGAELLKNRSGV